MPQDSQLIPVRINKHDYVSIAGRDDFSLVALEREIEEAMLTVGATMKIF